MKSKYIIIAMILSLILGIVGIFYNKKETKNYTDFSEIKYELKYSKSKQTFDIIFNDMYNNISINYDNKNYSCDDKNTIIIDNQKEGTILNLEIIDSIKKDTKTLKIKLKYYNEFYNSNECIKYKNIINACDNEFMDYKVTETLFKNMIKNYENSY